MKQEIDTKKFLESMLKWGQLGVPKEAIMFGLKEQGLTLNNDGEITTIESNADKMHMDALFHAHYGKTETKTKLTEFEEKFSSLIGGLGGYTKGTCSDAYAKAHSEELLSIARKQILSKIDWLDMVEEYANQIGTYTTCDLDQYRKGILDTIKKIKGE